MNKNTDSCGSESVTDEIWIENAMEELGLNNEKINIVKDCNSDENFKLFIFELVRKNIDRVHAGHLHKMKKNGELSQSDADWVFEMINNLLCCIEEIFEVNLDRFKQEEF